jgi:GT2 family glycosyltransferase
MTVAEAGPGTDPVAEDPPWIGVVVVAYAAGDYIAECLESLVAAGYPRLKVIVVDNASPDDTAAAVRDWASGARPFARPADWPLPPAPVAPKPRNFAEFDAAVAEAADFEALGEVALVHSGANRGFAGGVNVGLRTLLPHPQVSLFWILNPDCAVEPQTPAAFAAAARAAGPFSIMGGRAIFFGEPAVVQADGGRVRRWRGTGASVNINRRADECAPPDPVALDYIPGMSMVASRAFLDSAGLLDESWFLYFEEIDWAYRRGPLPLAVAPEARVRHRAGASIGSRAGRKLPSPLAAYIGARNRLRFMARWHPWRLPMAYVAALATFGRQFLLTAAWPQLSASLRGLHGLPPPPSVRATLPDDVWATLARRSWR